MTRVKMVVLIGLAALGAVYAGTRPEDMTREQKNKLLVEVAIGAINEGDWETLRELYSTKFVQHSPGSPKPTTWTEFELGCRIAKNKLPMWDYEIQDIIAEADKVAVRFKTVFKYKERFGGRVTKDAEVVLTEIDIFRIEGGRIVEEWSECDVGYQKEKLRTLMYYGKQK